MDCYDLDSAQRWCDVAVASALTTPGEFQNNQKAKYDFPKGI